MKLRSLHSGRRLRGPGTWDPAADRGGGPRHAVVGSSPRRGGVGPSPGPSNAVKGRRHAARAGLEEALNEAREPARSEPRTAVRESEGETMNPRKLIGAAGALALCVLVLTAGLAQAARPLQPISGDQDPIVVDPPVRADIALTATAAAGLRFVGANVTYTLVVTNNGDASAANATVSVTLPSSLTLVSAKVGTLSQHDCVTSPAILCGLGTLAAGKSARATVVAKATAGGVATTRFLARTTSIEANTLDNKADVSVTVLPRTLRPPVDTRPPVADPTPGDPGPSDPTPPGGTTTEPPKDSPAQPPTGQPVDPPSQPMPGSGAGHAAVRRRGCGDDRGVGEDDQGEEAEARGAHELVVHDHRLERRRSPARHARPGRHLRSRRQRRADRPRRRRRPPRRRRERPPLRRQGQGLPRRRCRQGRRARRRRRPRPRHRAGELTDSLHEGEGRSPSPSSLSGVAARARWRARRRGRRRPSRRSEAPRRAPETSRDTGTSGERGSRAPGRGSAATRRRGRAARRASAR